MLTRETHQRLRRLLLPFWSYICPTYYGLHLDKKKPEEGMCVATAFLIEMALPTAKAISGKIQTQGHWVDHSMVQLNTRVLDLTIAQFPDCPPYWDTSLDDTSLCIQTTQRINTNKAPEDTRFVTLLNRPNPIGRQSAVQAYVKEHPDILTKLHTLL